MCEVFWSKNHVAEDLRVCKFVAYNNVEREKVGSSWSILTLTTVLPTTWDCDLPHHSYDLQCEDSVSCCKILGSPL